MADTTTFAPKGVRRRRAVLIVTLLLGLVVIGGAIVWRSTGGGPSCEAKVAPVVARLHASVPHGPPAPDGARLASAKEYSGDCESDGPAIEWKYRYAGTRDAFTSHVRTALLTSGWTEERPGNLPGQLANFTKGPDGQRSTLVVFADGDGYTVLLTE